MLKNWPMFVWSNKQDELGWSRQRGNEESFCSMIDKSVSFEHQTAFCCTHSKGDYLSEGNTRLSVLLPLSQRCFLPDTFSHLFTERIFMQMQTSPRLNICDVSLAYMVFACGVALA